MLEREEATIIERPNKNNPTKKLVKEKIVTKPKIVQTKVVPDTKSESLQPIVLMSIKEGSTLMTDEWMGYHGLHQAYKHKIRMSLHNAGLEYIEIPYYPDERSNDSARGLYLNYLQIGNTIFVPTFGIESDGIAIKQFEMLFKKHTIRTIESTEIAVQGGVLNCISWNIRQIL